MSEHTCTACGEVKPASSFGIVRSSRRGRQTQCRECYNAKVAARRRRQRPEVYSSKYRRETDLCSWSGCDRLYFARGYCRRHYRQDRWHRGLDHSTERVWVGIGAITRGEQTVVEVTATGLGGGSWARCPQCGAIMHCEITERNGVRPEVRFCHECDLRVELNEDELSWVIYESGMTKRSRLAA